MGTGHFTQVVWKGSKEVGMGVSSDGHFVVCNYSPPGNWTDNFAANVLPLGTLVGSSTMADEFGFCLYDKNQDG